MSADRIASLMENMTQSTVFGELLKPVEKSLERVRFSDAIFTSIGMMDFIALGVLRHVRSMRVMRELIQALMHHEEAIQTPVARSTYSDALASVHRRKVLRDLRDPLRTLAAETLPDRLAELPGLDQRPVFAMDGTYQKESAHFKKCTPKYGGDDNPKGHSLLSFYDVRLGCPCDVYVSTSSEHELTVLRDYDGDRTALTRQKNALWLVDRAFIDAKYWDKKKRSDKITMITRMKVSLIYEPIENLDFASSAINEGVVTDLKIRLNSSERPWRLITFRTRRNSVVEFLTNDFILSPGLIAFLYSRRWEEEKCFDTWKNDFAQAKAWGKSIKSIENQVRLAIITSILVAMLIHTKTGKDGTVDEKSIEKQLKRQGSLTDGTDRPDWSLSVFRFTTKISRQVLRFLNQCLFKISSPRLYKTQLRPLLMYYL